MKETVIYCRHPRFKSWWASISKRLPLDSKELRFASDGDELSEVLQSRTKLLLIDSQWSDSLETQLVGAQAQVVLLGDVQGASAAEVWRMRNICMERAEIHAFIDFSRDPEFYLPVLRSALLARDGAGKMTEVRQLSVKLNALVSQNLSELHRIKRLHERLVPMRAEKLKSLTIHSKFAAGESAGGEFFDTVSRDREVLILLASSRSYIASSAILGHFEELRLKSSFSNENLESFITSLSYELKKLETDEVELVLVNIDLNNMEMHGYNYGGATMWRESQELNKPNELEINPIFVEKAQVHLKLNRGDRVLIRSSGLKRNLSGTSLEKAEAWQQFMGSINTKTPQEFMSELFYQLKKSQTSDFLKTDASAILIEVDKNAILQV